MTAPSPPGVPEVTLREEGWEPVEESVETLFESPTMRIRGATLRYDDVRTREALREATDGALDVPVRFFAATALGFEPSPPPGVSPTMFAPTLRTEARRAFAKRLRDRGLRNVEKQGSERVRVGRRTRARFSAFAAEQPLEGLGAGTLPLECWVGVWTDGSEVRVVTGGYPAVQLSTHLDIGADVPALTRSQGAAREEFFSLARAVE
ncbi:MAG: hypothetical protein V5A55_10535 [Halovenus sp.]